MSSQEVPFTELIQHPVRTTARLAGARSLRLRRRGGGDLVLMSADRARQEDEVVDLTARLLAGLLAASSGADLVRHVLPAALPWTRFLPAAAVADFTDEFVATTQAAAAVSNMAPVSQLLTEWRHTAEAYADPELFEILTRAHLDDQGPVPSPPTPA